MSMLSHEFEQLMRGRMSQSPIATAVQGRSAFPALGRTLAQIGLGTFRPKASDDTAGFALLNRFVELGGEILDTAAMYAGGESERVTGRWMTSAGTRDRVVLMVKGAYPDQEGRSRLTPEFLRQELEGSLERLGTDHVDVFMPHTDDERVPVSEIVDCLDEMVTSGLARCVGASNWTIERLGEAAVYASVHGRVAFACSTVQWSLAKRATPYLPVNIGARDAASANWYARTALPVLAWSALAAGYLGRSDDDGEPASNGPYDSAANRGRRRRAAQLGRELGRSAAQIALAWVMNQRARPFVLIGPGSVAHLNELWEASNVALTPEQLTWLDLGDRD